MHVLTSLKHKGSHAFGTTGKTNIGQDISSIDQLSHHSPKRDPSPKTNRNAAATSGTENTDRLMQMMDQKFSKFEDLITNIASSMGELRGEVNTMKGKLQDAKLL